MAAREKYLTSSGNDRKKTTSGELIAYSLVSIVHIPYNLKHTYLVYWSFDTFLIE
jgi:hypothetical protein